MKPEKVIRILGKYQKSGDDLLDEFELKGIKLKELQSLFYKSHENPMYECEPITQIQVKYLQKYVNEKIDITSYDYFLECYAVE